MAVMIKTLSQLPDPTWGIDGTTIWHEIAKSSIDLNLGTTDRYWSSWKLPLSSEMLYTIYSGTMEPVKGLDNLVDSTTLNRVTSDVNGSSLPGVLKTLELRNGLLSSYNLSVMHDELSTIVGNDTEMPKNGDLHISGSVTAVKDDVFKIGTDGSSNIASDDFKETSATVVPNAHAVYGFTKEALPILLSPKSGFKTVYRAESGATATYSNPQDAIKKETVPHDAYIFSIPNSGTESNSWITPMAGWFTCFGWLSEFSEGAMANYQRWVVLEGNLNDKMPIINETTKERAPNWCILQLQPFVPSPYISYVGFGVPVREGLELRIRTGFAVGSSSGNYAMSNTTTRASMANHIPNAFVGGIYSA